MGQRIARPYLPGLREGIFLATGVLVLWIALSIWQLYRVGSQPAVSSKRCPECGGRLERHTIRRGKAAGQSYWACVHFPKCDHTQRTTR